jgi:hypothetical protein
MEKILYITNSINENNQLGYRHSNILNILKRSIEIDIVNFEFTKDRITLFKKVINKIFIFPDVYHLYSTKYKKEIRSKIEKNCYESIVISVLPHSFLSLASFIRKLNPKLKIIVDMTDPLSINVTYLSYWLIYRLYIKCYERRQLRSVDRLIVLNESIKQYYIENYPSLEEVIVLEQGTNANEYKVNSSFIKNGERLELVYAGMLYTKLREPFDLYEAIANCAFPIRLSVYGSFKKRFLPPVTDRFYYGGLVDKELLRTKINAFDVLVFIDNFYGIQIPGKILENLATNKPLLFIYENENSPTLKYVQEYEGIFYAKNNAEEIQNALNRISSNERVFYERNITKYYWENLVKESYYF